MRNLGLKDIAARLERGLGELGENAAGETAGRGDAFAGQFHILQNPQRVGHVIGKLIGRLAFGPAKVLHEQVSPVRVRAACLGVNHPGVRDHLRMNIPIGQQEGSHQPQTVSEFALGPAWNVAVHPTGAGGIGNDAVLALDPVLMAPLAESADEGVGDLARQSAPVLLVAVGERLREVGYAK